MSNSQLRVLSGNEKFASLSYRSAQTGGKVSVEQLQILRVRVDNLPCELDGIIMTSDLQGVGLECCNGSAPLLGEVVAEFLHDQMTSGKLPMSPERTGVMLAGDLFATGETGSRGCSGDPSPVWLAFSNRFRWVAGVHGNHDLFPTEDESAIRQCHNIHVLDGGVITVDGLLLGGLGGIIGKPGKPRRRSESEYLSILKSLAVRDLDILLTHCGPDQPAKGHRGDARIRIVLEASDVPFHVFGHRHWSEPLCAINDTQLANVDGRVVVLERASNPRLRVHE